jgi:hypothetical protein
MPTLSREALYALAWAEPASGLTERYGVPASAFRQACREADIPLPGPGYWARLRAGKPVVRPPLHPRGPAMAQQVTLTPYDLTALQARQAELAGPAPGPPVFDEPIEALRARTRERVGQVKALPGLDRVWPDIRRLLAQDEQQGGAGARRHGGSRRRSPRDDLRFGSALERRRLRLLNALALGLARVGAKLEVRDPGAREIAIRVGSRRLAITLDVAGERAAGDVERSEPDRPLTLAIVDGSDDETPHLWADGDDGPLEGQLSDIVASILVVAEIRHRAAEIAAHARRIEWRAEIAAEMARRQADAVRRRDEREIMKAKARRKRLFGQARDWRKARAIRAFVAEVLAEVGADADPEATLAAWRAWALAEADALDPVTRGGLEPWGQEDKDGIERACGCGFTCERWCGCGLQRLCECACPGEQDLDDDTWLAFPARAEDP